MRKAIGFAVTVLVACFAMGAGAPKPTTQPATRSSAAAYNQKDIKLLMPEAQALAELERAGVKIVKRLEKKAGNGDAYSVLWLDDWRRVVINHAGKVSSIGRDTLPFKIPPEWQQDVKPWMSVADALAALEKSGVKVIERKRFGEGGEFLTLDDGRVVGFTDDMLYTIQRPVAKPAK